MSKKKFLVVWTETKAHRSATVYYQGWWHQYGEPMFSADIRNALLMSPSGARKAAARLRNPTRWGVEARAIPANSAVT